MRYEFSSHPEKSGWYLVTDTKYMFDCIFKQHEFNETQTFSGLDRLGTDHEKIAKAMNELGDWLFRHHYYEALPPSTYEIRLSEDDTELHVIRRKFPEMDARFETDDLEEIARALAKASEFIRKRYNRR